MRRTGTIRTLRAWSVAAALLLSVMAVRGDETTGGRAPEATAAAPPGATVAASETRDSVLMLETGPLLVRLQISLGGRSLSAAQEEYIERLFQSLDTDQDDKLSREELSRSPLRSTPRKQPNSFLQQLEQARKASRRDLEQDLSVLASVPVTFRQDNSAADKDQELFNGFDVDQSGQVEPGEMRTAALGTSPTWSSRVVSRRTSNPVPASSGTDTAKSLAPQNEVAGANRTEPRSGENSLGSHWTCSWSTGQKANEW